VDSDLVNFPVLVYLDNGSGWGSHVQVDGDDIMFVLYSDNSTKLNHEIESYSDGVLWCWVNITSLSSSVDTLLWLYYGNPDCDSQENIVDTWDSGYRAVYHLNGDVAIDSTWKYNATVTNPTSIVAGMAGNCYNFGNEAGESVYVNLPLQVFTDENMDGTGDDGLTAFTLEFWHKPTTATANSPGFLECNSHWQISWSNDTQWRFRPEINTGGENTFNLALSTTANIWQLVSLGWDTSEDILRGYKNGSYVNYIATTNAVHVADSGTINYPPTDNRIGWADDTDTYSGVIDEVRVSGVNRSASWIKTTYNTMALPTSFISIGVEEYIPINWKSVGFWGGSLFNISWYIISGGTWDGSIYNSSIRVWQQLEPLKYNGSIFNNSLWKNVETFNGSIHNNTIWSIVDDGMWNGSVWNQSLYKELMSWNGTIWNSTDWVSYQEFNGSIYNVSTTNWGGLMNWNGSIYNSSVDVWQNIDVFNGSIFNGTPSTTSVVVIYPVNNNRSYSMVGFMGILVLVGFLLFNIKRRKKNKRWGE